jgi:hypothetical protein
VTDDALSYEQQQRVDAVLERWLVRCRVTISAYNQATTRTAAADRRLGAPAAALSALVATGVFATLSHQPALGWRIATGIAAVAAAVLAALQTFMRLSDRAEQYRAAARAYGALRRRIEHARLLPPVTRQQADDLLSEIRQDLRAAAIGKPNVPQHIWDRAQYKVRGVSDARGFWALWLKIRQGAHFGIGEPPGG